MFVKQGELFWGLGHEFVEKVMDAAEKRSFDSGEYLFTEGEQALHFYTLINGRIKLKVGEAGRSVFIISRAGELFGWSSLVDREIYSASAVCKEPAKVIKINRDVFWEICTEYPSDGLVFMKRLAFLLGQRLLKSYGLEYSPQKTGEYSSHGTGQVMESTAQE